MHAVFGSLDQETLAGGLAAHVHDGIQARVRSALAAYESSDPEPTALHVGVSLPVTDLDLDGLLVGAGATVELCRVSRGTGDTGGNGDGPRVEAVRSVVVDLHLGVTDGWLAGGPGSDGTVGEVRWMSARIEVPLDERPGKAELVLHEAHGFGVERERWVVRADAGDSTAVPEVRVLLADVVARLRAASPDLAALLDQFGVTRDGGLDPTGLDRLLHDPARTVRDRVAADAAEVAARVRALVPAASGTGTEIGWSAGPATVGIDLAAGTFTAALRAAPAGVPAFAADVTLGAAGTSVSASLGALDPAAGGLRLVAGTAPVGVAVEWAAPSATGATPATVRRVALLPLPDQAALRDLATVTIPAIAAHALLGALRQVVPSGTAPLLDSALDAAGLLTPADDLGFRTVVVPLGLVSDPAGWLRHGAAAWRANAAAGAVALLEAVAPLVVPGRGSAAGWPLADGVVVGYAVEDGDRLRLRLDVSVGADVGGSTVTTRLAAGLLVGPDGRPHPTLSAGVDVDGRGPALEVAFGTDPPVRLVLLRPPAAPLPLYPHGPGLGDLLTTAGKTVVPVVLNALAGHRSDAGNSVLRTVGQAVFDLGEALDLRDGATFTATRLTAFAADPPARLAARIPHLLTAGAGALATALDPAGTLVAATTGTGTLTLGFGSASGPGSRRPVEVVLDAAGPLPAIEVRADVAVPGVGRFALERLRMTSAGVDVAATLGPLDLDLGAFTVRPLLVVRAGSAAGSARTVGLGLALDDAGARSVEFRFGLDGTPPTLAAVRRATPEEPGTTETFGTAAEAAHWLLAVVVDRRRRGGRGGPAYGPHAQGGLVPAGRGVHRRSREHRRRPRPRARPAGSARVVRPADAPAVERRGRTRAVGYPRRDRTDRAGRHRHHHPAARPHPLPRTRAAVHPRRGRHPGRPRGGRELGRAGGRRRADRPHAVWHLPGRSDHRPGRVRRRAGAAFHQPGRPAGLARLTVAGRRGRARLRRGDHGRCRRRCQPGAGRARVRARRWRRQQHRGQRDRERRRPVRRRRPARVLAVVRGAEASRPSIPRCRCAPALRRDRGGSSSSASSARSTSNGSGSTPSDSGGTLTGSRCCSTAGSRSSA